MHTEPIGSIPRPADLIGARTELSAGRISEDQFREIADSALRDTLRRFEETGSPVITDGEQTKSSFATYPLESLSNLASDGVVIPFEDGHTRQLPRLVSGPFRYGGYASRYLSAAKKITKLPVKQAVISASALSLLYPADGIPGYTREEFLTDLVSEAVADIRSSLEEGADSVQIDFTEGRLSLKLDPAGGLLESFVALNNRVLDHFSAGERARIGIHTCAGSDRDAAHSADVEYAKLLPVLFRMHAGRFYIQLANERDPEAALAMIAGHIAPGQTIFVGVTDPIRRQVETPELIRDRVMLAAKYIPVTQLGTTDDCGFSPFADDTSTSREIAFAKITARVAGTAMAARELEGAAASA